MLSTLNVFPVSRDHVFEPFERLAIWWQDGNGNDSPDSWAMDYATVVSVTDYQMTVRVAWIGSTPQLMTFRRRTRDCVPTIVPTENITNYTYVVRERDGIPVNYRD